MTIQISVTCLLRALKTKSNGWSNGNKWVMHIRAPIGNALDVGHKYRNSLNIKALFGLCKSISGKYSIFRKCYFLERKMFLCVWLHFKKYFEKYFLMFGCVLENTIENTFSTCFSHFLTFSRLPNEYMISFIPQNTNKTQKKIIKSEQTKARSRSRSAWSEIEIAIYRDRRDRDRRRSTRCLDHFLSCVLLCFGWVCFSLLRVLRKSFEGKTIM